ncbi:MAG: TIGR04282 family arsenosugar biosynthesis glycosyltransferase [Planctomycetota bacterium]
MTDKFSTDSDLTDCLGVFAKFWEPGKVKTRLAESLGHTKAARIYEAFVAATIARLSSLESHRVLAYTPNDAVTRTEFEAAGISGWKLMPQSEGNLGDRIASFFDQQFAAGAQRVVLLGTDSPNLPLIEVQEAFEHLKTADVVLGPTSDGGYYLIGAKEATPPIFSDMPWSTRDLLSTTVTRLDETGVDYVQLDPWYDVDELFDLHQLIEDLRDERENEPSLEVLLRHVLEVIES